MGLIPSVPQQAPVLRTTDKILQSHVIQTLVGTRQDDISIQRFSLPAANWPVVYILIIVNTAPDSIFLSLLSIDALSLSYQMSLYGISLYHVRKPRPKALCILLLTTAKGSSGR